MKPRKISKPAKPWTFEDRKTLAKYAGKIQLVALAEMMGRTVPSLKNRARKQGLCLVVYGERNPTAKFLDAEVEQARRLHETGHGPESIARITGVCLPTVRSWVYFKTRRNDQIQSK